MTKQLNMSKFLKHKKIDKKKLPAGCIGYVDDLTQRDLIGKHVAGDSGLVFDTEENYLEHTSPVSKETVTSIEHLDSLTGGRASIVAEAAIKRGDDRKK